MPKKVSGKAQEASCCRDIQILVVSFVIQEVPFGCQVVSDGFVLVKRKCVCLRTGTDEECFGRGNPRVDCSLPDIFSDVS